MGDMCVFTELAIELNKQSLLCLFSSIAKVANSRSVLSDRVTGRNNRVLSLTQKYHISRNEPHRCIWANETFVLMFRAHVVFNWLLTHQLIDLSSKAPKSTQLGASNALYASIHDMRKCVIWIWVFCSSWRATSLWAGPCNLHEAFAGGFAIACCI